RRFVGDVLDVIPERPYKEEPGSGLYVGYSDNYLQLVFPGNEQLVGKVCRVRLDEPAPEVCGGRIVRVLDDAPRTDAVWRAIREIARSGDKGSRGGVLTLGGGGSSSCCRILGFVSRHGDPKGSLRLMTNPLAL